MSTPIEQFKRFQKKLRQRLAREEYKRIRKPLIDKWGGLSETDKQYTRQ